MSIHRLRVPCIPSKPAEQDDVSEPDLALLTDAELLAYFCAQPRHFAEDTLLMLEPVAATPAHLTLRQIENVSTHRSVAARHRELLEHYASLARDIETLARAPVQKKRM